MVVCRTAIIDVRDDLSRIVVKGMESGLMEHLLLENVSEWHRCMRESMDTETAYMVGKWILGNRSTKKTHKIVSSSRFKK